VIFDATIACCPFAGLYRKGPSQTDEKALDTVERFGYCQSELARHLAVHYSTISRWLREYENATKKT
jgi:transposase